MCSIHLAISLLLSRLCIKSTCLTIGLVKSTTVELSIISYHFFLVPSTLFNLKWISCYEIDDSNDSCYLGGMELFFPVIILRAQNLFPRNYLTSNFNTNIHPLHTYLH
jgi:hypothetical protein